MRKIKIEKDIPICGCPPIKKGTTFKVEKFNSRYVYVNYIGCSLRLPRKDVSIVY